jgi:hypothetical protein
MEPVRIKIRGRERKVPYPEAYLQVIKEKGLKGDPKAGQILISIFKELGILKPEALSEPYEFTLKIGKVRPPFQDNGTSDSEDSEPERGARED